MKILLTYSSKTGNTKKVAKGIYEISAVHPNENDIKEAQKIFSKGLKELCK